MKSSRLLEPYDLETLLDETFWQALCPELSLTLDRPLACASDFGESIEIRTGDWETCKLTINQDAYFAYDSYLHAGFVDRMAESMRRVEATGLTPAFCFVYDEFWECILQLDPLLTDLIGEYEVLPAVWAWFVKPDQQTAFKPHRDGVRDVAPDDDEHLDYLTIWIPLTDLNPLTSSISVLPASQDPDYDAGTSRVQVKDLQAVRSLQASRGSVLCWTIGLAHWGTRQTEFAEPRLSVGYFVQHEDAECLVPPAMNFDQPLTLPMRLAVIGQQIIDYSRDADERLLKFAAQLTQLDDSVDSESNSE